VPLHWKDMRRLVALLQEDLKLDRALTINQVVRMYGHYGITHDDARRIVRAAGFRIYRPKLRPYYRAPEQRYEVCYASWAPPYPRVVPHLLGAAEMRRVLRHRIVSWEHVSLAKPSVRSKHRPPDVLCEVAGVGMTSLEYDHGGYSSEQILKKAEYCRLYTGRQIWCTPVIEKAVRIAEMIPDAEVWWVSWDEGRSQLVSKHQYRRPAVGSAGTGYRVPVP